jgi:hypothetical protein
MAWTLEAHAVVAERYSTPKVNTALVQGNPVGAIAILDNSFRGELIFKRRSAQPEVGILRQVHHLGLSILIIKHPCLVKFEVARLGSRKIRFLACHQGRAELTRQVRIEHIQGT